MEASKIDSSFERALSTEIMASERIRVRVLFATLAVVLILDQLIFLFAHDIVQQFTDKPLPIWLPLRTMGPFVAYEAIVLVAMRYRHARGMDMPTAVRFANAAIETSLPTFILWWAADYLDQVLVFGTWPSLLYFVFIVASTLRLDFWLSIFTGAVAAAGYLGLALALLPPDAAAGPMQIYHVTKAAIMLAAGVVAGLVAMRLRGKFRSAVEAAAARERVINLFGQHVSPAVAERLLESPAGAVGETRTVCVMFLDIRNFTANARSRRPEEVVEFLNSAFAFMIEAIDRHGGFINKFLGDGFMAIFGAPLDDPAAARHAVPPRTISLPRSTAAAWPASRGRSRSASACMSVPRSPAMSARPGARNSPPSAIPSTWRHGSSSSRRNMARA
jgi:adenylate cyclase